MGEESSASKEPADLGEFGEEDEVVLCISV